MGFVRFESIDGETDFGLFCFVFYSMRMRSISFDSESEEICAYIYKS